MKRILFLTPPGARYGFSLTGVLQRCAQPGKAGEILDGVLEDPEIGLVIVDERLLAEIGEDRWLGMEKRWGGILIVLPAPEKGAEEGVEDYALRLVRRAIGYHVRLNL